MDNVTLTPHAAFRTLEASETLIRRAIDIAHRIVGRAGGRGAKRAVARPFYISAHA